LGLNKGVGIVVVSLLVDMVRGSGFCFAENVLLPDNLFNRNGSFLVGEESGEDDAG
jgi:hypothetical protein